MLTNAWRRRFRSPAAWALAMTLGMPMAASAQQSGLFPFWPIQRERVPCAAEDPVYAQYRNQYFGYHPTCWRRFPAGWGCPSPEAPDIVKEFKTRPRDAAPSLAGPDDMGEAPPPDMDGGPAGAPGGAPAANPLPPIPSERSPFDLDNKPGAGAPTPRPGAQPPANPPGEPLEVPPAGGSSSLPSRPGTNPIAGLPDPADVVSPTNNSSIGGIPPVGTISDPGPQTSTTPAQAPRRSSVIGGFFAGITKRWR